MELITSKFRKLYIVKLFFGYLTTVFGIIICIKFNNRINELIFLFLIIIICSFISGSYSFLKLTKVILRKNDIEMQSFLGIRKKYINYTQILKIDRIKIIRYGKAGSISDGFYLSKITLSDGSSFILSPDKFENYNQIMNFIESNKNSHYLT